MTGKTLLLAAGTLLASPCLAAGAQPTNPPPNAPDAQAATPAGAQKDASQGAPAEAEAGEIVVTAQRRSERLVDVPVSVTALTAETLAKVNTTGLFDVTKSAPGVVINRNGGYLQPTIRGIGTNVTGGAADPNVAIYLDGVYQASQTGNFFDLANVQQVEILKGPQGTLFGRNATGGAILITTSDPAFTASGRLSASYGRYNEGRVTGYFTTPLTETLAMDVSAYFRRSDGFKRDLLSGALVAKQRSFDLRSKLLWKPSEDTKVVLTLAYNDTSDPTGLAFNALGGNTQGRLVNPATPVATGRTQLSQELLPEIQSQAKTASLRIDQDLGFASLRSISAYRDEKAHIDADLDASYVPVQTARYDQPLKTFSQEVTLTSPSNQDLTWVVGGFYYHANANFPAYIINGVTTGAPSFHSRTKVNAFAGFADGTYKFGRFAIIAGLRYSTEKRGLQFGPGPEPAPYTVSPSARFSSWTPRIGLRYSLTGRSNIYATYSKGFKSGLFNTSSASLIPVAPEKVDAYEVGYKVASSRFDFNTSAFYYKYNNIQVTAFDFTTGVSRLFNAARAEIYGFDAEATLRATSRFDVRAAFAYTHGEYSRFPGAIIFTPRPGGLTGNLTQTVDASGNTMLRAPRVTVSSTANYRIPAGDGEVELSATPYYTSRINYTYDERIQQPGYFTLDASIAWAPNDQLRLSVWGRNITDTTYASFRSTSSTRDSIVYATPRTYGVSAGYRF